MFTWRQPAPVHAGADVPRRGGAPAARRTKTRWQAAVELRRCPCFPSGGHLYVFVCVGCDARLTTPLSQVALPAHAHQKYGNGIQLPVLMESGTFAVDP